MNMMATEDSCVALLLMRLQAEGTAVAIIHMYTITQLLMVILHNNAKLFT